MILHAGIPLFHSFWTGTRDGSQADVLQSLAFFLITLAPACAIVSALATAACFTWMQKRHGSYQVRMRKLGKRGNLADLRDVEDRRNWQSRQDAVERMKGPEDVIGYTEDGVSRVA